MIGLQLQQVPSLSGQQYLRIEQNSRGKFYELLDYYQSQPKVSMQFNVADQEQHIEYVLTPPSLLQYINPGEKFGAYIGDMMFINSELAKEHQDWIPYIALKLHAEKFIPNAQMDENGIIKHHETLYRTIRFAASTMNDRQLYDFLSALKEHENSGYMDLDQQAQDFLNSGGSNNNFLDAKRVYLERHHRNRYVAQGRIDEDLTHLGISYTGYRNHAQAVFNALVGSNTIDVYLASAFTAQLASIDPKVPIILTSPFSSLAYAMTKEVNGLVDLVEFKPHTGNRREDLIVKLPGRMSTWTALRKRLSYDIHRVELNVQNQIEHNKTGLEQLVIEAKRIDDSLTTEIQQVRALVQTTRLFSEARNTLAQHATKYRGQLQALDETSTTIATRLQELESLSDLLVAAI